MIKRALLLALSINWTEPSAAETKGGVKTHLDLSFGVILDRDPNLSGARGGLGHGLAALSFGITSATRTQKISLLVNGNKTGRFQAHREINLSYERATKTSQLFAQAFGRKSPYGSYSFQDLLEGSGGRFDLVSGNSALKTHGALIAIELGKTRPVGASFTYSHRQREVLGVSPLRSTSDDFGADFRMDVSRKLSTRLSWELSRLNTNESEQTEHAFALGLEASPMKTMTATFEIGWRNLETSGLTRRGAEWSAALTRARSDGHIFGRAALEQTQQGSLSRVTFGIHRSMAGRKLKLEFGVAHLKGAAVEPSAKFEYSDDTKLGRLTVLASRDFAGSTDTGETRIGSTIGFDLTRNIDTRSKVKLSAAFARTNATAQTEVRSSGYLSASFHRKIKKDWGWMAGASRRTVRSAASSSVGSNAIFFNFERSFFGGL